MIARAECMREHGVPNFPDPTFTADGISVFFGPGVDPQSPAFVNAQSDVRERSVMIRRSSGRLMLVTDLGDG